MSNDYRSKIRLIALKFFLGVDYEYLPVVFFEQKLVCKFQRYLRFQIVIPRERLDVSTRNLDNSVCDMCANFY